MSKRYRLNYLEDGLRRLTDAIGAHDGDPFDAAIGRLTIGRDLPAAAPFDPASYETKKALAEAFAARFGRDLDQSKKRAEMESDAAAIIGEIEGAS